jgi:apolipoprotein D and lipocalin family protein
VALLPNRFQAVCVADTQAEYRPDADTIEVINRCRKSDGNIEIAKGVAEVVPASGNSKLRVSFFRPFYGNYWILDLDPGYQWVLVGEPARKYGWVLSRTAVLPEATLNAILDKAASLGYRRSDFHLSPQTTPLD